MPYLTRDQMVASWDALVADYPSVCSSEVLGKSVQNRDIKLYKIGNSQGGRFAIIGDVNGEEKASVEIILSFAQWVASSSDPEAIRIRERNLLLIVPMLCIDTYDVKTPNANGTDLYFNFDFDFGPHGGSSICSLAQYTDQTSCAAAGGKWMPWNYRGPYALSEPETRILKQFFHDWMPRIELACHDGASGNYIWYVGGLDVADRTIVTDLYQRYNAKALEVGVPTYGFAENAYGGGRPEPCAYFHNDKKIQALIVECCTHDPEYSTIASTHYPKMKPLFITLAQAAEIVPLPPLPPSSPSPLIGIELLSLLVLLLI